MTCRVKWNKKRVDNDQQNLENDKKNRQIFLFSFLPGIGMTSDPCA